MLTIVSLILAKVNTDLYENYNNGFTTLSLSCRVSKSHGDTEKAF